VASLTAHNYFTIDGCVGIMNKTELYTYLRGLLVAGLTVSVEPKFNSGSSKLQVVLGKVLYNTTDSTFNNKFSGRTIATITVESYGVTPKDPDMISDQVHSIFANITDEKINLLSVVDSDVDEVVNANKWFATRTTFVFLVTK